MNSKFEIKNTTLKDAYIIVPFNVDDNRGSFTKDFLKTFYKESGLDCEISETFYAKNIKEGTIRGMHFAYKEPQAKIVKSITGKIYDVIIDLRKYSPTYLKWEGFELSEDNNYSLFVPKGFAHGYMSLTPGIVSYKCIGNYNPKYDTGINYKDETFNINWPIINENDIIISEKDNSLKTYKEMKNIIDY